MSSTPLICALLLICAVLLSWTWSLRRRLARSLNALHRTEASALATLQEAADQGTSHGHQVLLPLADGMRWFELSIAKKPGAAGQPDTFVVLSRDIHDRHLASEELERQIRFYSILSRCNRSILASHSEAELLERFCQEAISSGALRMAWIGMRDPQSQRVRPLVWAGDGTDYLRDIEISCAATSRFGRGPTGTAIREDRPFWCQDFQNDPATSPWHGRAARFGWLSSASLPLHRQGLSVGALTIYASEVHAFTPGVQQLLCDMAACHGLRFPADAAVAARSRRPPWRPISSSACASRLTPPGRSPPSPR